MVRFSTAMSSQSLAIFTVSEYVPDSVKVRSFPCTFHLNGACLSQMMVSVVSRGTS